MFARTVGIAAALCSATAVTAVAASVTVRLEASPPVTVARPAPHEVIDPIKGGLQSRVFGVQYGARQAQSTASSLPGRTPAPPSVGPGDLAPPLGAVPPVAKPDDPRSRVFGPVITEVVHQFPGSVALLSGVLGPIDSAQAMAPAVSPNPVQAVQWGSGTCSLSGTIGFHFDPSRRSWDVMLVASGPCRTARSGDFTMSMRAFDTVSLTRCPDPTTPMRLRAYSTFDGGLAQVGDEQHLTFATAPGAVPGLTVTQVEGTNSYGQDDLTGAASSTAFAACPPMTSTAPDSYSSTPISLTFTESA